jgi:hypothetical protein
LHLNLQSVADPMEADAHVVLLYLEYSSQFFDRQPLDVTQQEQACVITVQSRDGAPKLLLQQHTGLDGDLRRPFVVAGLRVKLPAAQYVDRRVNGGAPEVGGWELKLDLFTLGQYTEEDGLQNVLGVGRISSDTQGRAEYCFVMALVQLGKPRHDRLPYLDAAEWRLLQRGENFVAVEIPNR